MFKPISDLSQARILISNDDGINAQGIKILEKIARSLSKDVWVVAPESEQSASAHSLTLRRPLRMRQVGRRRYAVDGTPTDSVLLAINLLMKDKKPDLVLSGINRGVNLGEDVTYSGTVAAAMEGILLGVPSMAFSQQIDGKDPVRWAVAEAFAADIIRKMTATGWAKNVLINVNFPNRPVDHIHGIEIAHQGKRKIGDQISERFDPRGDSYIWIGGQRVEDRSSPGTDIEAIHRGVISITPLCVDFTHRPTMEKLAKIYPLSEGALRPMG